MDSKLNFRQNRFEAGTGGEIDGKKMRTFEESVKSQKTVASMIENPNNNKSNNKKVSAASKSAISQALQQVNNYPHLLLPTNHAAPCYA